MPAVLAFLGTWEVLVILFIALLLFGTRLPKVARSMGQGVAEFKKGMNEVREDIEKAGEEKTGEKESNSKT